MLLLTTTVLDEESLEKRKDILPLVRRGEEGEETKTQLIVSRARACVCVYIQSQNHRKQRATKHRENKRENILIKYKVITGRERGVCLVSFLPFLQKFEKKYKKV